VNIAALVELIKRHLGLPNVTVEPSERFDSNRASAIERLLARTTAFYDSITRATKHFEKHAGARWVLDMDEVERYVIEAVRVFEPAQSQALGHEEMVVTGERVGLSVYAAGKLAADPASFRNAAGDPV
jgi:hypothetical protein